MKIKQIKTGIVTSKNSLEEVIDQNILDFMEDDILAITSKIVAVVEGNIVNRRTISKDELIKKEADFYLDIESPYTLTIKQNILIPAAGIDESNSNGKFILWPKDPYESARKIRDYIAHKFKLHNLGVIITDSRTSPLRWGTTGIAIGYAGFKALKDYRKTKDIFGHELKVTQANHLDALAAAAVFSMGEGNEETPMALINDLTFLHFDSSSPTKKEISELKIAMEDDIYGPLLSAVSWKKGK